MDTKNRQPAETLQAMIARAYGPEQVPPIEGDWLTELTDGWFNVAYRIQLRSGAFVVLKIAPPASVEVMTYERGAMATELAALSLIREHTTVPVPTVDYADHSHELCDADYFFMSHVDADNLALIKDRLSPSELDSYNEAVGAITRMLNSITGKAFGPLTAPQESTWRSAFLRMMFDVLDDGERRGAQLGYPYSTIREVVIGQAAALAEVIQPRFVEWDLWAGNCMVRNGQIVAILDHERAFWGDPLMEFGFTGSELSGFGSSAAFIRGYGRKPFTDTERVRRRLYNLYLVLIQIIEMSFRAQGDAARHDWLKARLRETLTVLRQI